MSALWRYTLAQASWQWLLQPALATVIFLWALVRHPLPAMRSEADLYSLFEYFLPLAAALYFAGLPAWEREEGAAETHLTYVQWPSWRWLLAGMPRAAAWTLTAGAALAAARLWYLPGLTGPLARAMAPGAFSLAGAALAGSALARHQAGGMALAGLWWFSDLVSLGKLSHPFYLFRLSTPPKGLDLALATRNLWLLGAALWFLALLLAHWRSHWVK